MTLCLSALICAQLIYNNSYVHGFIWKTHPNKIYHEKTHKKKKKKKYFSPLPDLFKSLPSRFPVATLAQVVAASYQCSSLRAIFTMCARLAYQKLPQTRYLVSISFMSATAISLVAFHCFVAWLRLDAAFAAATFVVHLFSQHVSLCITHHWLDRMVAALQAVSPPPSRWTSEQARRENGKREEQFSLSKALKNLFLILCENRKVKWFHINYG